MICQIRAPNTDRLHAKVRNPPFFGVRILTRFNGFLLASPPTLIKHAGKYLSDGCLRNPGVFNWTCQARVSAALAGFHMLSVSLGVHARGGGGTLVTDPRGRRHWCLHMCHCLPASPLLRPLMPLCKCVYVCALCRQRSANMSVCDRPPTHTSPDLDCSGWRPCVSDGRWTSPV